jgi:2-dehydro-3-deoxyglucarate aldolase
MVPLVRVGENNPNLIKRVMDVGSYGVIVPNVKNAKEARDAVAAVKYPPAGTRGVGLYRAQKFGLQFDEYKKWLSNESVVIIQIEHIDAVNNIDEIFMVPDIDAYMIGPYDLSGSIGKPGEFNDSDVIHALQKAKKAAARHNIPAGFHSVSADPEEAKKRRDEGYSFLAFSVDTIFLANAARTALFMLKG